MVANVLLGINQGLAWSMTVVMKIDLVGPKRRGLALGLNEAAGYGGVALAAGISGWLAADFAARDVLVAGAAAVAVAGLAISVLFVRDTGAHVELEQHESSHASGQEAPRLREAFAAASWRPGPLRAYSQAGFVNNLNDALAWGLIPLYLAANGAEVEQIGLVAAIYPAVWGTAQIGTGAWSDRIGRKLPIVAGMLTQAAALGVLAAGGGEACLRARRGRGARTWDGTRLSDADRGDLRRGKPGRTRIRRRRLPVLARLRLRRRGAARRARR